MNDNMHVERRFKFEVAPYDLAFIKGLNTIPDKFGVAFDVKIPKGQPYILHKSDHTIPIINHEDRWFYGKLYAVNVAIIGGYHGVYADSENEAYDILADYAGEFVDDPDKLGATKRRWPGLVGTWLEAMDSWDQDEVAVEDFTTGPFGNESLYFYSDGNGISAVEVHDPKIPPTPDDLFPYIDTTDMEWVLDHPYNKTVRQFFIEEARHNLSKDIGMIDEPWAGVLEDRVHDHPEEFPAEIDIHLRDDGDYDLRVIITRDIEAHSAKESV